LEELAFGQDSSPDLKPRGQRPKAGQAAHKEPWKEAASEAIFAREALRPAKLFDLPPDLLEIDQELDREEEEAEAMEREAEERQLQEEKRRRMVQQPDVQFLRLTQHKGPARSGALPRRQQDHIDRDDMPVMATKGAWQAQAKRRTRSVKEADMVRNAAPLQPQKFAAYKAGKQLTRRANRNCSTLMKPAPPHVVSPMSPIEGH
jgi:hypothetical protein